MRRSILPVAMACAAVANLAHAAGTAPAAGKPVVTNPDWLRRPSGEDMTTHYPALAGRLMIAGGAVLGCRVSASGALVDCRSLGETPAGLGFGAAAVEMAPLFEMRPQTVNGKPVDGGNVRIPIRFVMPQTEPAEAPPAASSEEAMRQARRLVDAGRMVDSTIDGLTRFDPAIARSGLPTATIEAARQAVRKAAEGRRDEMRDSYAQALASIYSEEEMQALADFALGPGKAIGDNAALQALQAQAREVAGQALREAAHKAFCAQHACGTAADLARVWRPADPRDSRIDNPQWVAAPSAYQVRAHAPALAQAIGVTGVARLTCRADASGQLEDCSVDEQLPAGLGFGDAALGLAASFRLSPIQLADGGAGRRVTVRAAFPAAESAPNVASPKPRSPRARELARQLIDAEDLAPTVRRDTEIQILKFESRPKGADTKTYDAAIEAYRAGRQAALALTVERAVDAYAAAFSEDDLAQLAAFRASPAGKAQKERQPALQVALAKAAAFTQNKITLDARAGFCALNDCTQRPFTSLVAEGPGPAQAKAASPEPSTAKP